MAPSIDQAVTLLCELGDEIRDTVVGSRHLEMSAVEGRTAADTVYAVDRVADDALEAWFRRRWTDVEVVTEGLEEPLVLGRPQWTVIVDTIDGTRGLMYDKRPAWTLAALAPHGGTLRHVVAAVMTELPTTKQALADQVAGVRGSGVEAHRLDLRDGARRSLELRPSTAPNLDHGWAQLAKFFPPGKADLARLESELFSRLGAVEVFDDQYVSTGGQVYELLSGRDRFVADLRPLVSTDALACHPYDICTSMLLEEAGAVVTDPWGDPLDCPLDTTTPVAWVGYANAALADTIAPVLAELLRSAGHG